MKFPSPWDVLIDKNSIRLASEEVIQHSLLHNEAFVVDFEVHLLSGIHNESDDKSVKIRNVSSLNYCQSVHYKYCSKI